MGGEATSSLSWANVFNVDTALALYDAGKTCFSGTVNSADCIGSMVGVASSFDPTGISNIIKIFI